VTHASFQRGLRISLVAAGLLLASALGASAQDPDPLGKLDGPNRFIVELLIDSATTAGLPSHPLLSKALEGISKKADGRRIVEAVRKKLGYLRVARSVLGPVDEQELSSAASLLEAGAKPAQLELFRPRKKGRTDLEAFIVWADFLERGVPSEEASSAITKLWQDGADDDTFHSLWTNVQSDISQGLNPGAALQNRIRETPGRVLPVTVKPPEGQQENQSSR
jgi:hypothetical protein